MCVIAFLAAQGGLEVVDVRTADWAASSTSSNRLMLIFWNDTASVGGRVERAEEVPLVVERREGHPVRVDQLVDVVLAPDGVVVHDMGGEFDQALFHRRKGNGPLGAAGHALGLQEDGRPRHSDAISLALQPNKVQNCFVGILVLQIAQFLGPGVAVTNLKIRKKKKEKIF